MGKQRGLLNPHQQWGDVGLEVQGCDASIGNAEGRQRSQEQAQQGLDNRQEPEQGRLERALWLDDLPCTPTCMRRAALQASELTTGHTNHFRLVSITGVFGRQSKNWHGGPTVPVKAPALKYWLTLLGTCVVFCGAHGGHAHEQGVSSQLLANVGGGNRAHDCPAAQDAARHDDSCHPKDHLHMGRLIRQRQRQMWRRECL